jgi:hypothetical protein
MECYSEPTPTRWIMSAAGSSHNAVSRCRIALLTLTTLCISVGCHRTFKESSSVVNVADESTAGQLLGGFYPVEGNSWRWAAPKFSVMLKPPPGSDERGAVLQVELYIPPNHIEKLGPITLNADAGGYLLRPETFPTPGKFTYSSPVPANEMDTDILPVNFCIDKSIRGSGTDSRDFGAVVMSIALRTR